MTGLTVLNVLYYVSSSEDSESNSLDDIDRYMVIVVFACSVLLDVLLSVL